MKYKELITSQDWARVLTRASDDDEGVKIYIGVDSFPSRRNSAMDWILAARTSCVLVSGTLLLGGCMTPGLQYRDSPSFTSTIQQIDPNLQAVTGHDVPRYVTPAGGEVEVEDVPRLSTRTDVRHEKVVTPH